MSAADGSLAFSAQRSPGNLEFRRLASVHVLSAIGDSLVTLALAGSLFFDISPTAARGKVALSLILTVAPFAVVAPFLGPAMDRHPEGRRLMLIGASIGRAVTSFLMLRVLDSLALFPVAFAMLVLSKAHSVAKVSLVPEVVKSQKRLVEANSKLAILGVAAGFVGAGFGALVLTLLGPVWVVGLSIVFYVLAGVASMRIVGASHAVEDDTPHEENRLEADGITLAATAMAALRGIVGFVTFFLAFTLRRQDAPTIYFGIAIAGSMAGSFLGSLIAPPLRRRIREEIILAAALITVVIGAFQASNLNGLDAGILLSFTVGLAANTAKLGFDSLVQRDAPWAMRGRSFAKFEAGFQIVWVIGALIPVVLVIPASLGYLFVSAAAGMICAFYVVGRFIDYRMILRQISK